MFKIKEKYNKWLFKKYGFVRGALFESIPWYLRLKPLFSPSIYGICEASLRMDEFKKEFEKMEYRINGDE